jgi:hypothetical protein
MATRANGYFYTGVRATEQEEQAMQSAYRVPLMVLGGSLPISGAEVVHATALRHQLPEIVGHYGYDFQEHEFIRLPDADQGEPDKWPSRRLRDILKSAGYEVDG